MWYFKLRYNKTRTNFPVGSFVTWDDWLSIACVQDLKLPVVGSQIVGLIPLKALLDAADFYIRRDGLFIVEEEHKIRLVRDQFSQLEINKEASDVWNNVTSLELCVGRWSANWASTLWGRSTRRRGWWSECSSTVIHLHSSTYTHTSLQSVHFESKVKHLPEKKWWSYKEQVRNLPEKCCKFNKKKVRTLRDLRWK